jgi:hypothetical protein
MNHYWVTFESGKSWCCDGENEFDATRVAEHVAGAKIKEIAELPYPALPILWQYVHPVTGSVPAFCYKPDECAGRRSCPRNPCCDD